ncbi:MAG: Sir2 family NAD-dependent protein deacetylase [Candidatus Eremiobacterota bacterium]
MDPGSVRERLMQELRELLKRSRRVLVFTGAGISTGSGIPDFRGPQGVWKRRQPVYFDEFLRDESKRVEHWDYKLEGWDAFRAAQPNPAHRALVRLEEDGRLLALVTQNIDGLHHRAGHSPDKVLELHGTNRLVECLGCGRRSQPEWAFEEFRATRRCPRCPECGGLIKTATISFGQTMPAELLERAMQAARSADLVLALGSSLSVEPAASVPLEGWRSGATYVVVNQGPTAHDRMAHLRLEGDLTRLLPAALC